MAKKKMTKSRVSKPFAMAKVTGGYKFAFGSKTKFRLGTKLFKNKATANAAFRKKYVKK